MIFLASQSMNHSSVFRNYFDLLPRDVDHALFYSPPMLGALQGSRAHGMVLETMTLFKKEMALIQTAAPRLFAKIGVERLRWAFAATSSRSWQMDLTTGTRFEERDEDTVTERVMAPLLDMFNHMPDAKSSIYYKASDGMIYLETDRGFNQGEEIYISYGDLHNHELLLQHGFVLPSDSLGLTTVRVPVDMMMNDSNVALKRYLIEPLLGFDGFLDLSFGNIDGFSQAALELIVTKPCQLSSQSMGRIFEMRGEPVSLAGNQTLCKSCSKALRTMDAIRQGSCPGSTGDGVGPAHASEELVCAEHRLLQQCTAARCQGNLLRGTFE